MSKPDANGRFQKVVLPEPVKNGLIEVVFRFNGVVYRRTHQLAGNEMKAMKMILEAEGKRAQEAIIWKATFWGADKLARGVIRDAIKGFLKQINFKAPEITDEIKASQDAAFASEVKEASEAFLKSYNQEAMRLSPVAEVDLANVELRIIANLKDKDMQSLIDNASPTGRVEKSDEA